MTLAAIALRVIFSYVWLLVLLRMSGKRTVGEASPMDFVVALILGDMVDDMLWSDVPASTFVAGTAALLVVHALVSMAASVSESFRALVEGQPLAVMEDGRFFHSRSRLERFTRREALAQLRCSGMEDAREVDRMQIEVSGDVSVLPRDWARPVQRRDQSGLQRVTP